MAEYDVLIIGGGIVGLATAFRLSERKPDLKIAVLEKERQVATHQTGHNSGVIHSGIYYPPGSLKAQNCIRGYGMLLDFCKKEKIPHEICGKIIVATTKAELPQLEKLRLRGIENGLDRIEKLTPEQIKEREPHVTGLAGLFVPQTGIVDYKTVTERYAQLFFENGGEIKYNQQVYKINPGNGKTEVVTNKEAHSARVIVNCAGLYSDKVAQMTEKKLPLRIIPFRGEYYKLKPSRSYLVKNLVYPVPDPAFPFLGVHFTRMVGGGVEAGPNAVPAWKREGYHKSDFDFREFKETFTWPGFIKVAQKYWKTGFGEMYRSFSKTAFTQALQKLIPEIRAEDLEAGGAGVRAQACHADGTLLDDFHIIEGRGIVHVCNAPSPAATSSLSIGETVAEKASKMLG